MPTMKTAGLVSMLILLSGCAHVEPKPINEYDVIRKTRLFSIGRITDAGVLSDAEIAFRALLEDPAGKEQFRQLLSTATPAGQLYGLLGLRLRDKRAFEAAAPRYLASHTEVSTMEGCSAGTAQTKDIARKISIGYFK